MINGTYRSGREPGTPGPQKTNLPLIEDFLSGAQSAASTIALIIGGVWAYFKFIKDRVYRPRFDIGILASRVETEEGLALLCELSVRNIGATRIKLLQEGTGLVVSSGTVPDVAFREPAWQPVGAFEIFRDHGWVESAETIRHDVLVSLDGRADQPFLLEVHLVCKMLMKKIGIHSRRISAVSSQSPGERE